MYLVNPKLVCTLHLIQSHKDIHDIIKALNKGCSINSMVELKLVDVSSIKSYHDAIAEEMCARKIKHSSPVFDYMINTKHLTVKSMRSKVKLKDSLIELNKCPDCKQRLKKVKKYGL